MGEEDEGRNKKKMVTGEERGGREGEKRERERGGGGRERDMIDLETERGREKERERRREDIWRIHITLYKYMHVTSCVQLPHFETENPLFKIVRCSSSLGWDNPTIIYIYIHIYMCAPQLHCFSY